MGLNKPVKVIAVTGGKGGVGKTNVAVNLAVQLSASGYKTMLLDADLGLANVDIMLGIKVKLNLSHVMEGECSLHDIILQGPAGLQIVPSSSGTQQMSELSAIEHAGIIRAFSEISEQLDYLIVDIAAGITDSVISFTKAAQEIVMVVCNEPTSLTDAYALMKILNRDHQISRFHIVANMIHSAQEGREIFNKLTQVTSRFLDVTLTYLAGVPYDENVRRAVRKQKPLVLMFPRSPAAVAVKSIAKKIDGWPPPDTASGNIEFFMERLVGQKNQMC